MSWTTCDAQLEDAEEITRLHRRAAQTGFAHIFPPEAPPPPFGDDLALWQFALGPDAERGRKAHTVRLDGRIIGVTLAGPDPDDPPVGHLSRIRAAVARLQVADGQRDELPSDLADLLVLPPRDRAVLHFHYVEGHPYDEVGRLVGCMPAAARKAAERGRARLSESFDEENDR